MKKVIVVVTHPDQERLVRETGVEVLAEYPNGLLVRASEQQQAALRDRNLEIVQYAEAAVRSTGNTFAFSAALEANSTVPGAAEPHRTAYYLLKLVGPAKGEWLDTIRSHGISVHGTMANNVLLAGGPPARVEELKSQPWLEEFTPYRAAMKVSPKLSGLSRSALSTHELATPGVATQGAASEQVEINVFPGESSEAVAAQVRSSGGMVLSTNALTVTAVIPRIQIPALAEQVGVQSILPHRFPKLHNNKAREIMEVPAGNTFGDLTLRGAGQLVAIADSGLDTGNPAAIHQDFTGRIASITSLPNQLGFASNDAPPFDDGPQDTHSSHGTHVAGSVLGSGAAAVAAGSATVPAGTAPEARVFFQAVEQNVHWKTAAQLIAAGITPPADWPPPAVGLYGLPDNLGDLFTPAYAAGARIHTNSWGSPDAGQYASTSRAVDQFMFQHRDMLILFSAGNEGLDADSNGVIDADSIGSPGTAKNCITVGATENNRPSGSSPTPGINGNWNALSSGGSVVWPALGAAGHVSDNPDGMAAFSSRGPTDDGRIKPDVVAPGTNVLSTRSSTFANPDPLWGDVAGPLHGLYCWSGGTSMSTPLVAGAAALVRQHLVEQRGHVVPGSKPSGALIKAFLVNGAVTIAGQFAGEVPAGPNNVSGFGRADLTQALIPAPLEQALFVDEPDLAVSSLEMRSFDVQAMDAGQPLKVTLVWTDAPSPVGTGGLVNQQYLRVRRPDGTMVDGDVVPFSGGVAANNVQQVTIASPVAGNYQILVHGLSVAQHSPGAPAGPNPRQDFALVVSNGMGFSLAPISLAQAIDTTGSMSSFGYIGPAKERANQLIDFMRANDKLSLTEFSDRPGVPHARTPYPLHLLSGLGDWTSAHTAIGGLVADGLTPIGAGLLEAWNQLSAEPSSRPRGIVLLSDGLNNVPPDPMTILSSIPTDVPIFSVALGPAGSTPTLQNIANSRPNGGYFVVEGDEDVHKLHEIYAAIQALAGSGALAGLSSFQVAANSASRTTVPIEKGVKEVTFTLSWDSASQETNFVVTGPDGRRYDSSAIATFERKSQTYWMVRVAVPKPGMWTLETGNKTSKPSRFTVSAAVHSAIALSATATQTGPRQLRIAARLLRSGKPYDAAKVVARVTVPSVSRDQVLKKYKSRLQDLRLPPELAERGFNQEQLTLMKLALLGTQFRSLPEGLFGRNSTEVVLKSQGNGTWVAKSAISVPGNATMQVIATGKISGIEWQRVATLSMQVPEAAAKSTPKAVPATAAV